MNLSHDGNSGDILAALPAIRRLSEITMKAQSLFLVQDVPAFYYEGAVHPVKDAKGELVSLNAYMINMLLPLLEAQSYIQLAKKWEGESIALNLCDFRKTNVGMPAGNISRWYFMKWPDLSCDLTVPYIELPETKENFAKGKIIINRSQRYLNTGISYSFLKAHQDRLLFAGTESEHLIFLTQFGLEFPRIEVSDFLQLAQAYQQCDFCLGNQSSPFQLAQGLMIPRILEVCEYAPNVHVVGENAFDFSSQLGLEYHFNYLLAIS